MGRTYNQNKSRSRSRKNRNNQQTQRERFNKQPPLYLPLYSKQNNLDRYKLDHRNKQNKYISNKNNLMNLNNTRNRNGYCGDGGRRHYSQRDRERARRARNHNIHL